MFSFWWVISGFSFISRCWMRLFILIFLFLGNCWFLILVSSSSDLFSFVICLISVSIFCNCKVFVLVSLFCFISSFSLFCIMVNGVWSLCEVFLMNFFWWEKVVLLCVSNMFRVFCRLENLVVLVFMEGNCLFLLSWNVFNWLSNV